MKKTITISRQDSEFYCDNCNTKISYHSAECVICKKQFCYECEKLQLKNLCTLEDREGDWYSTYICKT